MNQNVLVLNSSYFPLCVTTVMKSVSLLFRDKAEVIEVDEDGGVVSYPLELWEEISLTRKNIKNFKCLRNGTDYVFEIPKIIRIKNYYKANYKVGLSRNNIFLRDNYTCQYCGKKKDIKQMNIDHVIPKAQGGKGSFENLVCSCISCNEKKRDRTPSQAGMKLLRNPKKPSPFLSFKKYLSRYDKDPFKYWLYFFPDDFVKECKK